VNNGSGIGEVVTCCTSTHQMQY